jgi:hypothetical protein
MPSKQQAYASNLQPGLGEAMYHPVPFQAVSGRVGDIAFINKDGGYEWIRNAFDADVIPLGNAVYQRVFQSGFGLDIQSKRKKLLTSLRLPISK